MVRLPYDDCIFLLESKMERFLKFIITKKIVEIRHFHRKSVVKEIETNWLKSYKLWEVFALSHKFGREKVDLFCVSNDFDLFSFWLFPEYCLNLQFVVFAGWMNKDITFSWKKTRWESLWIWQKVLIGVLDGFIIANYWVLTWIVLCCSWNEMWAKIGWFVIVLMIRVILSFINKSN